MLTLERFELFTGIPSVEEAKAFILSACEAIGIGFHPDTPFDDYVNGETGEQLFRDDDAEYLDSQLAEASAILNCELEDVYDVCVTWAQEWYKKTQEQPKDDADQPVVIG